MKEFSADTLLSLLFAILVVLVHGCGKSHCTPEAIAVISVPYTVHHSNSDQLLDVSIVPLKCP